MREIFHQHCLELYQVLDVEVLLVEMAVVVVAPGNVHMKVVVAVVKEYMQAHSQVVMGYESSQDDTVMLAAKMPNILVMQ